MNRNFKKKIKKFIFAVIYYCGKIIFFYRSKPFKNDFKSVKRILFISLYFRGDVLFHTPVISLLKFLFPNSLIDVWVKERSREIIERNPDINEIITFDGVNTDLGSTGSEIKFKEKLYFLKRLKANKYDLVIDYTGLFTTSLFSYLLSPAYSIGKFEQRFGFFYNKFIDKDTSSYKGHLIQKYIDFIKLGFNLPDDKWAKITKDLSPVGKYFITQDSISKILQILKLRNYDTSKKLIIIHLTAGWDAKRMSLKKFSALIINLLITGQFEIGVIGSKSDRVEFNKISREIEPYLIDKTADDIFFDTPLELNAALISKSSLLIGSDSMPLHLTGALNIPSIGLFGPTNPSFSNPTGNIHQIVYHELKCSAGINDQYCTRDAGRTCDTIECMAKISINEIIEKVNLLTKSN